MNDISHLEKSLGLISKSFKKKIAIKFHKYEGIGNLKQRVFNGELGWKPEYSGLRGEWQVTTWAEQFSSFFKDVARGFDAQLVGREMGTIFLDGNLEANNKSLNILMSFDLAIQLLRN